MCNPSAQLIYFQMIYPKDSYTFERGDYVDFAVGWHVEGDETIDDVLQREAKEELGISVETDACPFLGMRVCRADCSENYKVLKFQHFFAIFIDKTLKDMNFLITDGEVKAVVEIGMDDYLSLLLREKEVVFANEMVLDKVTREGT